MSQLMLQAPGAQDAGTGTWQDVRFSGRANEQNVIKYDGVVVVPKDGVIKPGQFV